MTEQNYIVTAHQKDVVNTMENKQCIWSELSCSSSPTTRNLLRLARRALIERDLAEEQWREGRVADRVHFFFFVSLLKGAADVL